VTPESEIVIRDCAVNDFGNSRHEFVPQLPPGAATVVSSSAEQPQQQLKTTKPQICVSTCHWSSCNRQPLIDSLIGGT